MNTLRDHGSAHSQGISFIKKYLKWFILKNTFREELSFPGYWEVGRPLKSDRDNCARKLQIFIKITDFKQNYRFKKNTDFNKKLQMYILNYRFYLK